MDFLLAIFTRMLYDVELYVLLIMSEITRRFPYKTLKPMRLATVRYILTLKSVQTIDTNTTAMIQRFMARFYKKLICEYEFCGQKSVKREINVFLLSFKKMLTWEIQFFNVHQNLPLRSIIVSELFVYWGATTTERYRDVFLIFKPVMLRVSIVL